MSNWSKIEDAVKNRIIMLDGAMGTMLQKQSLQEDDFRGERFQDWPSPLQGNNDLLVLTKPEAVEKVHHAFLKAGADLIETNSFNATTISQADYDMAELAPEIARAAAQIARKCADEWTAKTPEKPRCVLGSVGPMNKTLSISPKVEDPGFRDVTFDEVKESYIGQIEAMIDIVDAILIETVFDTLNCKAAIAATHAVFDKVGYKKPILISGTITDRSGRTLSGQTPEAFWISIAHANPFAVGLNCALGADEMRPHIEAISRVADTYVIAFPNAGLPNAFGEYDETPSDMSGQITPWVEEGFVNILGGCCGTTPEHIAAIAQAAEGIAPRHPVKPKATLRLSGLEPFQIAV
ncbi:methionine synthase I (cobalamin-dependent) [Litorimonas taeanensis]|uniref:Methionine synthase n=1 Tax=Litorimonas taeanensis TaxID=568099 RepID=A0A420WD16_9PROT|nr:homocysteine S-methyltransferase family protein [Litorimonas taeanensis]RKQ68924.1 methionine synthase I (cobalamin-dependent) [Litorimonas taeanensis]